MRLRFRSCVFDSLSRELIREGKPAHLSPKAFRLLELLLEAAPRALPKAEIYEKLWPGTFVSEASLTRLVAEVRAAIGDNARQPSFIRTVYGHGYAFASEVADEPPPTSRSPPGHRTPVSAFALWVGARKFSLWDGENVLGRSLECAIPVEAARVSRRHARILVEGGRARIEDLGSKNGTFLQGRRLETPAELCPGDQIQVGTEVLTFQAVLADPPTETDLRK